MANILVLDDAQTYRDIIGRVLSNLGHAIAYAENGVDVVLQAEQRMPDVVLIDTGMDGLETLRALKEYPPTAAIPVVLVSIKLGDVAWQEHGAADYLAKPFTAQALVAVVYKTLGLSAPELPDLDELDHTAQCVLELAIAAEALQKALATLRDTLRPLAETEN